MNHGNPTCGTSANGGSDLHFASFRPTCSACGRKTAKLVQATQGFFLTSMGFCGCFGYEGNMFFSLKGPGNDEILLGFVMTREQLLTKKHVVLMHFFLVEMILSGQNLRNPCRARSA